VAKKIKITLIKSAIGQKKDQIATVKALGLNKIRSEVTHDDTPQVRGMAKKIEHLVSIQEV